MLGEKSPCAGKSRIEKDRRTKKGPDPQVRPLGSAYNP